MTQSEPGPLGIDIKPHAYDPLRDPQLFDGVLARRILAFAIDMVIIFAPVALAFVCVTLFVLVTFGLGWPLFWLLYPGTVVWILFYYGWSFGSPASATIGMRLMGLEMRTWYGAPAYFVLGAAHALAFYLTVSALTPLVLLVGLFNARKRLLHDFLLGTVVINAAARAAALRPLP